MNQRNNDAQATSRQAGLLRGALVSVLYHRQSETALSKPEAAGYSCTLLTIIILTNLVECLVL